MPNKAPNKAYTYKQQVKYKQIHLGKAGLFVDFLKLDMCKHS